MNPGIGQKAAPEEEERKAEGGNGGNKGIQGENMSQADRQPVIR